MFTVQQEGGVNPDPEAVPSVSALAGPWQHQVQEVSTGGLVGSGTISTPGPTVPPKDVVAAAAATVSAV